MECRDSNDSRRLFDGHTVLRVIGRLCLALIGPASQFVGRAAGAATTLVQNVSIDHCRPNVTVAKSSRTVRMSYPAPGGGDGAAVSSIFASDEVYSGMTYKQFRLLRVVGVEWRAVRATSPQRLHNGGSPLVPRGSTPAAHP